MRRPRIFLPDRRKVFLHKALKGIRQGRSGNGLRLDKAALASAAAAPLGINALAVPLELQAAVDALPHEAVVDVEGVLGGDGDAAVAEGGGDARGPRAELAAVRPVAHAVQHERRQVAELVGQHVAQPVVVGDDLGREVDGAVVAQGALGWAVVVHAADLLASPVCSPCRRVQLVAPDELHAAG